MADDVVKHNAEALELLKEQWVREQSCLRACYGDPYAEASCRMRMNNLRAQIDLLSTGPYEEEEE